MCNAQADVRFVPIADIPPFIRSPRLGESHLRFRTILINHYE